MTQAPHKNRRIDESTVTVKTENKEKVLNSVPSLSRIAQFIKSGQAAFGSISPNSLRMQDRDATSGEVQKWMLDQIRDRLAAASDLYHDDVLILRSLLKLEYSVNKTGYQHLQIELSRLMTCNLTYAVVFTKSVCDASIDEVPQELKDEIIRDVALGLGEVCIDMRDYKIVEGQLAAAKRGKQGMSAQPYPVAKLSATGLGEFVKQLYGLGLYKAVDSMLVKLQSEMGHAPTLDLHIIYIPFLQELIGLMLMYGIPLTNVIYSAFFESVLQNYLERFLGREPKQKDSAELDLWTPRASAARHRLESFDHSYFRDILGDRYDIAIRPALMKLLDADTVPQAHSRSISLITAAEGPTSPSPGHKEERKY